jgi:hypothetical protein
MAKLDRIVARIFGSGAGVDQIAKFGSLFAGTPAFSTDPAQVQSLSNWLTGWFAAAIGGNSPAIEDMNAAFFVATYQLAYLMQAGIAEWESGTTYYIGSLVNDGTGAIYVSRTDANINHLVSDATYWKLVSGNVMTALGDSIYGAVNGGLARLAGNTDATRKFLSQLGDGLGSSAAPTWEALASAEVRAALTGLTLPASGIVPQAGAGDIIQRARITFSGGTPSIADQSGTWITGLTDNGPGDTSLTITGFSVAPIVIISPINNNFLIGPTNASTPSTVAIRVRTYNKSDVAVDCDFNLIAMGTPS